MKTHTEIGLLRAALVTGNFTMVDAPSFERPIAVARKGTTKEMEEWLERHPEANQVSKPKPKPYRYGQVRVWEVQKFPALEMFQLWGNSTGRRIRAALNGQHPAL